MPGWLKKEGRAQLVSDLAAFVYESSVSTAEGEAGFCKEYGLNIDRKVDGEGMPEGRQRAPRKKRPVDDVVEEGVRELSAEELVADESMLDPVLRAGGPPRHVEPVIPSSRARDTQPETEKHGDLETARRLSLLPPSPRLQLSLEHAEDSMKPAFESVSEGEGDIAEAELDWDEWVHTELWEEGQ